MNTILSCPTCKMQMRIPADKHIKFKCNGCNTLIEANRGRIVSFLDVNGVGNNNPPPNFDHFNRPRPNPTTANSGSGMSMVTKRVLAGIGVLFLLLFIYMGMQKEKWAFERAAEKPKISKLDRFLKKYREGEYHDKALFLRDSLVFHEAYSDFERTNSQQLCNCDKLGKLTQRNIVYRKGEVNGFYEDCLLKRATQANTFVDLQTYKDKFPEGKYLDKIAEMDKALWSKLSNQYENRIKEKSISPEASGFIKELLTYGQQTRQNKIQIAFTSKTALQDWKDYSQEVRDLTDTLSLLGNAMSQTNYPLPSKSPPPSIKSSISQKNSTYWQQRVVSALQVRLDTVLSPNPFKVIMNSDNKKQATIPNITVDYEVTTLTDEMGDMKFPSLYVHTETRGYGGGLSGKNGRFIGYLLATGIQWNMRFDLPDSKTTFSMDTYSRPNSQFSGTRGNTDAYSKMLQSAFENYAVSLAEGVGL